MGDFEPQSIHNITGLPHHVLTSIHLTPTGRKYIACKNAQTHHIQKRVHRELCNSTSLIGHYSNPKSIVHFDSMQICSYAIMRARELEDKLILPHRHKATILTIEMHECFEIMDATRESHTWCEFSVDILGFRKVLCIFIVTFIGGPNGGEKNHHCLSSYRFAA